MVQSIVCKVLRRSAGTGYKSLVLDASFQCRHGVASLDDLGMENILVHQTLHLMAENLRVELRTHSLPNDFGFDELAGPVSFHLRGHSDLPKSLPFAPHALDFIIFLPDVISNSFTLGLFFAALTLNVDFLVLTPKAIKLPLKIQV